MSVKKEFEPLEQDWSRCNTNSNDVVYKFGNVVKSSVANSSNRIQKYDMQMFDKPDNVKVEVLNGKNGVTAIRFRCKCGCESIVELQME